MVNINVPRATSFNGVFRKRYMSGLSILRRESTKISIHITASRLLHTLHTGLTVWEPFLGLIRASGLGYLEPWLYIYDSRYLHDIFTFSLVALIIGHFYFSVLIPTNWKVFRGITHGRLKYDTSKKQTDK